LFAIKNCLFCALRTFLYRIDVPMDEFGVGGKETEKQVRGYSSKKMKSICAVQLTDQRKSKYF
jgi:hypothetical protein